MPPKEGGGYDGGSFCQIGKGKAEQRKRCEVNHEHSFLPFLYSPESGARNGTLWGVGLDFDLGCGLLALLPILKARKKHGLGRHYREEKRKQ